MLPRSSTRRGFTLIELLLVIAIIGILSTLAFSLFKAARNGNNKAKARGEIQGLNMAAEVYRKTYGDYPCGSNSASPTKGDQFRKDFFDQLVGRKRIFSSNLSSGGTAVLLLNYNDAKLPGSTNRKMKPFLSDGVVASNDDKSLGLDDWTKAYEFRDPWSNPYEYRYRVLVGTTTAIQNTSTGIYDSTYGAWKYPGFLLVSCGANFAEPAVDGNPPSVDDYWDGTDMPKSGTITPTYFNDDTNSPPAYQRSDNIVNWSN